MRNRFGLVLMAALGSCVASTPGIEPFPANRARLVSLDDRCLDQPGYADFRRELGSVVARRDPAGLEKLFTRDGAMRVHSIGRYSGVGDTSWKRPQVTEVWRELDDILRWGCEAEGGRLYLPAMAALVERGEIDSETDVALTETAIFARPDPAAPILRRLVRGDLVQRNNYDTPKGWNEVAIGEAAGYVATADLRSTHSFMLVLIRDGTSWKIREFISGV